MANSPVPAITARQLVQRHEVLLLDAYGVLIHHHGPLPHAARFIDHLLALSKPFYILTNDAARLPEVTARRMQSMGLQIEPEQVISSGSLLGQHFAEHGLSGQRCAVLGTQDSARLVSRAGGQLVPAGEDAPVLVLCDEQGFDFVDQVDLVLSALFRRLDRGDPLHLVLPNPDLVYPKDEQEYGITAGAMALLFEGALTQRYPGQPSLAFHRLGKPNPAIYRRAMQLVGDRSTVMVGDQLGTDIKGANDQGIPSVLVCTGLTQVAQQAQWSVRPGWLLDSLRLD